ncbi:hypothetical protein [Rhizobium wuzhouense]|uniref:Uncharacterized protein n=1 Tax=Rhizobium wuzhouense TaxID=1986026 RepID=A0ABX5NPQ8_9HYPH|nr:hypothetical protein [Rhizobium wuzhouense]PYB70274.1 hypothetical protein DMY87_22055 [Rhizobium wuzhouense]
MPIGFNLFSFDFFEAFRRGQQDAASFDPDRDAPSSSRSDENSDDDDARRRAADQAFWGLGYFPVL